MNAQKEWVWMEGKERREERKGGQEKRSEILNRVEEWNRRRFEEIPSRKGVLKTAVRKSEEVKLG